MIDDAIFEEEIFEDEGTEEKSHQKIKELLSRYNLTSEALYEYEDV